ncbi:MAG TPA: purine-nucleoside phosphorylase [Acidimicrobiales bacterium]|jgi:5'-methylthioadenosine phosphorylase/purine-nucleoside phosphorylase|nr:purine-nucleoside phosphorylase [Acidimicrobiales bacterium]
MPIHLRAEPGDYAPAVLCPGDPRRAAHIAETFFAEPRLVNDERGMLGYTGTFDGRPISVQTTGMGCPSAAIVFEELVMLGATRLIRVGTCGGLQPGMAMGDTVVALSATPDDGTMLTYTHGEPHAPTASWELVETAVRIARERGSTVHVGPIVTSDVFYDPDMSRMDRWRSRGHLGVEMESSVLFTIAALRSVQSVTLLTVSDLIVGQESTRISDEELRAGVDTMMDVACRVAVS